MTIDPKKHIQGPAADLQTLEPRGLDPKNPVLDYCKIGLERATSGLLHLDISDDGGWTLTHADDDLARYYAACFGNYMIAEFSKRESPREAYVVAINRLAAQIDQESPITILGVPTRVGMLENMQQGMFMGF